VPVGFQFGPSSHAARWISGGEHWQIWSKKEGGQALLFNQGLSERWSGSGLLEGLERTEVDFGQMRIGVVESGPDYVLGSIDDGRGPGSKSEALAFAAALKWSREVDPRSSFDSAVYVERFSRLLPVSEVGVHSDDLSVLGTWLTGGFRIKAVPIARLKAHLPFIPSEDLEEVIESAGLSAVHLRSATGRPAAAVPEGAFKLPGRSRLEAFFNEHIVDVVMHPEQYRPFGIEHPGAVILEGPPGCGKTFAVESLAEYLNWPVFKVDSESIGSPYIHETGRKLNALFRKAVHTAPSIVVIDEMEAFLSERHAGAGSGHSVEEIGEFLRRIPEAVKAGVLIFGMTNRIDMVDAAVQRRGRFDHIVRVDPASEEEIEELLDSLMENVPTDPQLDKSKLVPKLAGRPLSDVAFVVREAGRLAAKSRKSTIDQESLDQALALASERARADIRRSIGFGWRSS